MTYQGKLKQVDLGAGAWVLQTNDGENIQLVGDVPARLAGCSVSVQGREVEAMGFAMTGGRIVEVSQISER